MVHLGHQNACTQRPWDTRMLMLTSERVGSPKFLEEVKEGMNVDEEASGLWVQQASARRLAEPTGC